LRRAAAAAEAPTPPALAALGPDPVIEAIDKGGEEIGTEGGIRLCDFFLLLLCCVNLFGFLGERGAGLADVAEGAVSITLRLWRDFLILTPTVWLGCPEAGAGEEGELTGVVGDVVVEKKRE
jgi:hypothetical protein